MSDVNMKGADQRVNEFSSCSRLPEEKKLSTLSCGFKKVWLRLDLTDSVMTEIFLLAAISPLIISN